MFSFAEDESRKKEQKMGSLHHTQTSVGTLETCMIEDKAERWVKGARGGKKED